MSAATALGLYTIFPALILSLAAGISGYRVWRTREFGLLVLVAVLGFMLSHQMLEFRAFALTGSIADGVPEMIETSANTLAAVAVYYGTTIFERERELTDRLEESERRYRTLTEQSPIPILVYREEGIVYANEAAAGLLGGAPEQVIGRDVTDIVHPDDEESFRRAITGVLADGEEVTISGERLVGIGGQEREVLVSASRARYDGEPAVYLILRDVTREREYEAELEQARSRLEKTLESSNDAIFLIDSENEEIVDANAQAAQMLQYDREELIGLSPFEIHPHERSSFDQFLDDVLERGRLRTDRLSCIRKDGVEIPAEISASVTSVDGRRCVLAAVRDISERERRRKQADVLARVLRHNVKNDMTVVLGRAEFIEQEANRPQVVEAATKVKRAAQDLVDLSERVRDLRSTMLEGDDADTDEIPLAPVVRDVVSNVRADYPDASIVSDCPSSATVVGGKKEMLRWAIANLVENAVEHNDKPSPWAKITVTDSQDRRGDWISLDVIDNGPGIPESERDVVTDTTKQTELYHATSIGLWIVGQVADAFDGDVDFDERDAGDGTVATLHLRGTLEAEPTATA